MKRYRHLYPQVWDFDNLYRAYRRARKGKRGKTPAASFEFNLEEELVCLQEELRDKAYRAGPYCSFTIREPKRRLISAAPFRDRVVHHALCRVIEPLFERQFIHDSYANRVGKGTHRALDRGQQFARRYGYVLQADVRQFFPSIDHAILGDILARTIADADMLWLVDRILESGVGVLSEENGVRLPEQSASRGPKREMARPVPGPDDCVRGKYRSGPPPGSERWPWGGPTPLTGR